MKHLILAASAAMMLAACGQKADKASPSDSTTVKDTLVTTEAKTDFASPDLQMHGLKGQVKQVSTTEYESDKNGKQDFERNKTLLTFDPQGHWTGNENAQFKTGNITRDKDGRISKLTYSYLINKEEDYGYQYDYTYKYDAAGRLKAMGEEYVGELSGGFEYLFLAGVGQEPGPYAGTVPYLAFAMFQMMFAVITPALITGAVAGRMRFKSLFAFVVLWTLVVYYPIAHMVWGAGGWLAAIGSIDFAGGNVVHISSGVSALVLCLVLGRRVEWGQATYRVHNIPLVAIGTSLLLLGWLGFNSGSALAADGLAAHAFAASIISAAAAECTWMLMDVATDGRPTLVGACTGVVIGLVAITPGCGFVPLWAALVIGALASPICFLCVSRLKPLLGYDDALDAFGCHGVGGIFDPAIRWNGLAFGEVGLFSAQALSVVVTIALAVVGTLACVCVVRLLGDMRVAARDERVGLDITQHGERAYPSFNGLDD